MSRDTVVPLRRGAAELAAVLRTRIAEGAWGPQERLPSERALAAEHAMARGTVREALNRLAHEGLVDIRPGSGTYVNDLLARDNASIIESARPLELIDARFALEPHLCRLAVLHADQREIDDMLETLATMEASVSDPITFAEADTRFHRLLADSARNRLLSWMVSQINNVRLQDQWARMLMLTLDPGTIADYNRQHREIVNAIQQREPEQAALAMKTHLETARLSLTRAAAT